MNRIRHIFMMTAVLLLALWASSCNRKGDREEPELSVSLYIPNAIMTRAETGNVNPLAQETRITQLQIWVFLSGTEGTLVTYRNFLTDLDHTSLSNNTVTRFGLPLTEAMYELLTTETGSPAQRPTVDVYAVANAASAISSPLVETTSRDELDQLTLTKFGNSPLTKAVPTNGLPMSGMLKGADVTGGYPVLTIPNLTLTKAVSKIGFVFCQQANPATESASATPVNKYCEIVRIRFDGKVEANGTDCQIAGSQKLFTTQTTGTPGHLFDIGTDYTPLDATIDSGTENVPLLSNSQLALVEEPDLLGYQSPGHESESAEAYETRLYEAVGASSQVGPVYLRETDKTISGTITYRTSEGGAEQTASFSMTPGDIFSRNHSWIVYAYFVEETKVMKLKVKVLPWQWTSIPIDYTDGTVNVIRRFTVFENNPLTFSKVQTKDGFYDITFWHTVQTADGPQENILQGDIIIATPVGGILNVIPVAGNDSGSTIGDAFIITPTSQLIYPNYQAPDNPNGRVEHCRIPIQIKANRNYSDTELEGQYIDLHFSVKTVDNRYIDISSESIDSYRFILSPSWNAQSTGGND